MKVKCKKFLMLLVTAVCLCMAIGLMGCNLSVGEYEPLTPLTEEEIDEIRQAYFDRYLAVEQEGGRDTSRASLDKIRLNGYYGTYGGYKVCNITNKNGAAPAVDRKIEIGGIYIGQFNVGDVFYVYNFTATDIKDSFVRLERAYENGTITKADLRQIAYYYAQQGDWRLNQ